jgi:tetratricopeptide (TPR) repeat protein
MADGVCTRRFLLLIAALTGITLAAARFRARRPDSPAPPAEPPIVARLRAELKLGPVLAAEAALQQRPGDPAARLHLADLCAASGDPVGVALALFPLVDRDLRPRALPGHSLATPALEAAELSTRYARACIRIGWLDEAARIIEGSPSVPFQLALAAARASHGEGPRAMVLLQPLEARGMSPEQWLDGAMTWYDCRRPDRAAEWAEKAVGRKGEDERLPAGSRSSEPASQAALVRARCLLAAGKPEAASHVLPVGMPGEGEDGYLAYWRARAALRGVDPRARAAGQEQMARLAAAEPENAPAAFDAGRALLAAGAAGRALPFLSRAAVSGYQEVLCYDLLRRAYERLGRRAEALWAGARALIARGQSGPAIAALRRGLELEPRKPLAYLDLAESLQAEGRPAEAVAALEKGQKVAPDSLEIRLLKAKLLLLLERTGDVVRELEAATALDPRRANEPLGNLGTVYFDSQQYDRALPVLERAVQIERADAHSQFYLGRTYARRIEEPGQAEKAVEHLLRAAMLQPDYARPWFNTASVLQRMGYPTEAAACLRRAIAGDPASDAPYPLLAQILQVQGRSDERRLVLRQFAAVRGHDLQRTGLEKETRDHPGDAARRFALGDLLLREGRPRQALPELLVATGRRPEQKAWWSRLADACALLGFDDLRQEAEGRSGGQGPIVPR